MAILYLNITENVIVVIININKNPVKMNCMILIVAKLV